MQFNSLFVSFTIVSVIGHLHSLYWMRLMQLWITWMLPRLLDSLGQNHVMELGATKMLMEDAVFRVLWYHWRTASMTRPRHWLEYIETRKEGNIQVYFLCFQQSHSYWFIFSRLSCCSYLWTCDCCLQLLKNINIRPNQV